jgi:DNA polymerase III, gamma/tau subunits
MFKLTAELQTDVVRQLEYDIEHDQIAQSSLFSGPEFSGRLTAALELAEALSSSGADYTMMEAQNLYVFSSRNSYLRVSSALSLWQSHTNTFFRRNVIREIRIMLSQYSDNVNVLNAKDNDKLNINKVGEIIRTLSEERDFTGEEAKAVSKNLLSLLSPLFGKLSRTQGLSIEQIRLIQTWLATGDGNTKKFVVLENVEDSSPGAKNSLLKLLEEPPENAYLILVSRNPEKLLDTILSRVRKYAFSTPSAATWDRILKEKYYAAGNSFYEYLLKSVYKDDFAKFAEYSQKAALSLSLGRRADTELLNEIASLIDAYSTDDYFYSLISGEIRKLVAEGKLQPGKAATLIRTMGATVSEGESFYQHPHNTLERVFRECI